MFTRTNYSGYLLESSAIVGELARQGISVKHPRLFAEHVTFRYPDAATAPAVVKAVAVGYAHDTHVDCLVVELTYPEQAATTRREDGGVFHCTLSCAHDAKPVMSNTLLKDGWTPIEPFELNVTPF